MSHDLYFLYDKYGELLYVGQSSDAEKRLLNHKKRAWGHLIDHLRVATFYGLSAQATAKEHEIEAIKYEQPKYNLMHNSNQLAARQALAELGEFDKSGREHCHDHTRCDAGHIENANGTRPDDIDGVAAEVAEFIAESVFASRQFKRQIDKAL